MQAPINTPVVTKFAKDLLPSEMIRISGTTVIVLDVMPFVEGQETVYVAIWADGMPEDSSRLIGIDSSIEISVAMPACSPSVLAEAQSVEAQAEEEPAQQPTVKVHQYYNTDQGYMGYL